jgi:flagellar motor switch/type III secretory pathway protein FliN
MAVSPYPWQLHRTLSRALVRRQRAVLQLLSRHVEVEKVLTVAREVTGMPLAVHAGIPLPNHEPEPASATTRIELQSPTGDLTVCLVLPSGWVTRVANGLLERVGQRSDPRLTPDDRVTGLMHALVLEVAQRAAHEVPLVLAAGPREATAHASTTPPTTPSENPASGRLTGVDGRSRPADHPGLLFPVVLSLEEGSLQKEQYAGAVWLAAPRVADEARTPSLADLGNCPLSLPVCVGVTSAEREELEALEPGDVWLVGAGWWLQEGFGPGALVAPGSTEGAAVELTAQGIVYRGTPVAVPKDADTLESAISSRDAANLERVALEAPLIVRLELAEVSLPAKQWATLQPGDVLETGRPVGAPVVLRVAGKEVASGQLVTVDGEIGVRITEVRR